MEQHGFQIIVRIVRHCHFIAMGRRFEPRIADTPRGFLHGGIARRRSYVHPLDRQRYAEFAAQGAAERLVPVGLRAAQTVV